MKKYDIYCTIEQTQKAYDLCAPIDVLTAYAEFDGFPTIWCTDGFPRPCILPTNEEMCGWMYDNYNLMVSVNEADNGKFYYVLKHNGVEVCEWNSFDNKNDATKASIDAALEYISSLAF